MAAAWTVCIPCSGGGEDFIVNDGWVNMGMNMESEHEDGRDEALDDL